MIKVDIMHSNILSTTLYLLVLSLTLYALFIDYPGIEGSLAYGGRVDQQYYFKSNEFDLIKYPKSSSIYFVDLPLNFTILEQKNNIVTNKSSSNEEAEFSDFRGSGHLILMTAAGTFTSTGFLGNSSGYFDEPVISFATTESDDDRDDALVKELSFIFAPNKNMIPGQSTLMGAEDESVSILKAANVLVI